jgi:hypothetical protein
VIDVVRTVDIAAPVERVWPIMSDVLRWKEWTASISEVTRLDGGAETGVGGRFRVKQPRFPAAVWTVDLWEPPRRFLWSCVSPGARMVGDHAIERTATGCRVTLSFRASGLLGVVIARLTRSTTERYVAMEAEGLKRRSMEAA